MVWPLVWFLLVLKIISSNCLPGCFKVYKSSQALSLVLLEGNQETRGMGQGQSKHNRVQQNSGWFNFLLFPQIRDVLGLSILAPSCLLGTTCLPRTELGRLATKMLQFHPILHPQLLWQLILKAFVCDLIQFLLFPVLTCVVFYLCYYW